MTFVTIKSSSFQIQNLYFNKATVTDIENPVKLLYSSFFQGSEFDYLQPYFYKKNVIKVIKKLEVANKTTKKRKGYWKKNFENLLGYHKKNAKKL